MVIKNTHMKKILSVLLVLMVISSVVFARRASNPGAAPGVAVIQNGTSVKLYYKGTEASNVKISILNAANEIVFREVIRDIDGFVRPYDVAELAEGEYTIEVSDKNGKHTEKVTIRRKTKEKLAHVYKVKGEEGRYLLTVSNKGSEDITVRIYDESNNVIYDQVEAVSTDFARIYNLKQYSGKFTFLITDSKGQSKTISY